MASKIEALNKRRGIKCNSTNPLTARDQNVIRFIQAKLRCIFLLSLLARKNS